MGKSHKLRRWEYDESVAEETVQPSKPVSRAVAFFQLSCPWYRLGLFRRLCRDPRYSITFFIPSAGGLARKRLAAGDALREVSAAVYSIKLPFSSHCLKFQPAAVRVICSASHEALILPNDVLSVDVWLCCLLGRLFNRRICLWGHGFSRPDTRIHQWLRRQLVNLSHAVLFYTEAARSAWRRRGVPPEKLFVAPNALDTDRIRQVKRELTAMQLARFQTEQGVRGKSVVIFCGRLMERKRLEILLLAMALVLRAIPRAHAFIVGDGPLRKSLAQLAATLGLNHATTFFGEITNEALLAKCFLSSQAAVIPGAAGLGIQHAFSYGLPVIVGDDMSGHGPEVSLVTQGVTGLVCRSDDAASFAGAIGRMLREKHFRRELGANALRLVEQKYTLGLMAKGFGDALEYCFGKPGPRPTPAPAPKNGAPTKRKTCSVAQVGAG